MFNKCKNLTRNPKSQNYVDWLCVWLLLKVVFLLIRFFETKDLPRQDVRIILQFRALYFITILLYSSWKHMNSVVKAKPLNLRRFFTDCDRWSGQSGLNDTLAWGTSMYYVSRFWGFFAPPPPLSSKVGKHLAWPPISIT